MPTFRRRFQTETIEANTVAFAPAIESTEPIDSASDETQTSSDRSANGIDLVFACQDFTLRLKSVEEGTAFRWVDSRDGAMLIPRLLTGNRIAVQGITAASQSGIVSRGRCPKPGTMTSPKCEICWPYLRTVAVSFGVMGPP